MTEAGGPPRALIVGTAAASDAVNGLAGALAGWRPETAALDGNESPEAVRNKLAGRADVRLACLILLPQTGLRPTSIDETSLDDWRRCREILPFTASVLQALRQAYPQNLTIVVLGPQIALTGSAGMAALSAAMEGQRSLAKVAARDWGQAGVRVHWVGVDPASLSPAFEGWDLPVKPDLVPKALGAAPGLAEVARLLPLLASADAQALTGASLLCDGGGWMVP